MIDEISKGLEFLSDAKKKISEKGWVGGLFDIVMDQFGDKDPEVAKEANEAKEEAEEERASLFEEVGKSMLLRQFPRLSALIDLGKMFADTAGVESVGTPFGELSTSKSPEVVFWQNEFETISALLLALPGSKWKGFFTNIFANSKILRKLVEKWPLVDGINVPLIGAKSLTGNGSIREKFLNEKDPDSVIAFLRIMHQDIFVTGKLATEEAYREVKKIIMDSSLGKVLDFLSPSPAAAPATS